MNHNQLAEIAIEKLKELSGVSKIILYGSVARGTESKKSDIDIAIILDDSMRFYPLDMEGYPEGYQNDVKRLINSLEEEHDVKFHIPLYYESEFEEGIELFGKRNSCDLLHKVGIVKWDLEYAIQN